jgi:hypothetical protein
LYLQQKYSYVPPSPRHSGACNRSGRSPLSDLSESGDTFGVSGNMWVTDTLLEKRRGIGRIGDTVWSLV